MNKPKISLPNKPSELIRVALEDLEKTEADERYIINMAFWHRPTSDLQKCHVCLAGAVLAQRSGASHYDDLSELRFVSEVRAKLFALDDFREGSLHSGLRKLDGPCPTSIPEHKVIAPYEDDPAQFKSDMRGLADMFAEEGL